MLDFDIYKNNLPFALTKVDSAKNKAFYEAQANLDARFKADALQEVGLDKHPKADKAFALAWAYGHAYGLASVFDHLQDIAEVLLDD